MSQTKVKSGLLNFPDQTDFVKLPSGTTAQRPSSPEEGYSRYNTTDNKLEFWDGTEWKQLPVLDPPTLTSVDYPGNDLAADTAGGQTILINGTNFVSGISVEIGSTQVSSVTLNSTTQLAITSPALTAGDYNVTVTNLDATTITALDFISYNGVPSWVTASGSLGSLIFGEAISTISLSATEPDGGNVSYAITSGALPAGLTLSSSGNITGTMPSGSAETTYTFTVTATDDENQSTDRSFSITGVVPFVNNKNFTTVTYTGNGGTESITGVGFQPDLVWIKNRDDAYSYQLYDSVRGVGSSKNLQSDNTKQEGSDANLYGYLSSFDADGYTVQSGTGGSVNDIWTNDSGVDYVAWCWKAGGSAVTNTDGTYTSQVSANTEAGFSVVKFNKPVSTSGTVGHGLNTTPQLIIAKSLDVTENWSVNTSIIDGSWDYAYLNETDQFNNSSLTPPNSNVFYSTAGGSTSDYIAYCFAEVEGFSSFGSYDGTGTGGHTIITGFEPAFVMMKAYNTGSSWFFVDNKRNLNNPRNSFLRIENINAEADAAAGVNFLGNGFEFTGQDFNDSGVSWIYMAFAENPNTQVPTKADSFNTVLYTGNSSTQSVTGVGFQPDLVWIKSKNISGANHNIYDSVRGAGKTLFSNATLQEYTTSEMTGFSSDGFDFIGTAFDSNNVGNDLVAWCWKAGGTPYINTDGSITSVVSANPAAGFSIATWTGQGGSGTIGHGLNTAPKFMIVKNRTTAVSWLVQTTVIDGSNDYLFLNLTDAASNSDETVPTDSVYDLSPGFFGGASGNNFVGYFFTEVVGFSKFGSYAGTGSAGNFQDCGFEPAFVILRSSSGGNWRMWDNKRSTSDPRDRVIISNGPNAEFYPDVSINFTSTGFSFNAGDSNNSGETFIYMAFANQF